MRIIIATFVCEDQKYLPPYSGWLRTYFKNITINHTNQSALPENDHLTTIPTIYIDEPYLCTNTVEDQCHSGFCRTFVPSVHPRRRKYKADHCSPLL